MGRRPVHLNRDSWRELVKVQIGQHSTIADTPMFSAAATPRQSLCGRRNVVAHTPMVAALKAICSRRPVKVIAGGVSLDLAISVHCFAPLSSS